MKNLTLKLTCLVLFLLGGAQYSTAQSVPGTTNIQINLVESSLPVNGNKTVNVTYGTYSTGNQTVTFTNGMGAISVDLPLVTLKTSPTTQLQVSVNGVDVTTVTPETVPYSKVTLFAYEADNASKIVGRPFDVNMTPQIGDILQWDGTKWIAASIPTQISAIKIVTPENFATIKINSYDILKFEGVFNLLEIFTNFTVLSKLYNVERVTIYGGVFKGTAGNTSTFNTLKTGCNFIFNNSIFNNVKFDGCGDTQFNNCKFTGDTYFTPSCRLYSCELRDGIINASSSNLSDCSIVDAECFANSISNSLSYQSIISGVHIYGNNINYSSVKINTETTGFEPIISNNFFDRCKNAEGAFISISVDARVLIIGNRFSASFTNQYVVKNAGINTEFQFINNYCWDTENVFNTVSVGSYSKLTVIGNIFKQISNMGLSDNGSNIRFISNIVY